MPLSICSTWPDGRKSNSRAHFPFPHQLEFINISHQTSAEQTKQNASVCVGVASTMQWVVGRPQSSCAQHCKLGHIHRPNRGRRFRCGCNAIPLKNCTIAPVLHHPVETTQPTNHPPINVIPTVEHALFFVGFPCGEFNGHKHFTFGTLWHKTTHRTQHNRHCVCCVYRCCLQFPFCISIAFHFMAFYCFILEFSVCLPCGVLCIACPRPTGHWIRPFWGYGLRVTDYGLYQLRTNDATCRQQKRQTKGAGEVWLLAFDVACPGTAKNHKRKDSGSERLI